MSRQRPLDPTASPPFTPEQVEAAAHQIAELAKTKKGKQAGRFTADEIRKKLAENLGLNRVPAQYNAEIRGVVGLLYFQVDEQRRGRAELPFDANSPIRQVIEVENPLLGIEGEFTRHDPGSERE